MSLTLTAKHLSTIREVQELLIAPLRFPSPEEWADAVQDAMTDLFGVERSALVLPIDVGEVRVLSPNLSQEMIDLWTGLIPGAGPQANRYADPVTDLAQRRLAASGAEIWNWEIATRLTGIRLEDMPRVYPEVVRPGSFEEALIMASPAHIGRAMLALFPDEPLGTEFGSEEMEALGLVLPAFKAGVRAQSLSIARWRRLAETLDTLDEGVAVFRSGEERYRNRALRRILAEESERNRLQAEITACAQEFARAVQAGAGADAVGRRNATGSLSTGDNRYRIAPSHLEGGGDGVPLTVAVVVRPAVPALPSGSELRERYGLTDREAEVAALLARGHSNRGIAERLGVSPHTARHHAQRVLEKVGTGSRKALAVRLLQERD